MIEEELETQEMEVPVVSEVQKMLRETLETQIVIQDVNVLLEIAFELLNQATPAAKVLDKNDWYRHRQLYYAYYREYLIDTASV